MTTERTTGEHLGKLNTILLGLQETLSIEKTKYDEQKEKADELKEVMEETKYLIQAITVAKEALSRYTTHDSDCTVT